MKQSGNEETINTNPPGPLHKGGEKIKPRFFVANAPQNDNTI
jgi:hypothetical protein